MPLYDYRCARCDERFEVLLDRADQSPVECPRCGERATRQFSPFATMSSSSGARGSDAPWSDYEGGSCGTGGCCGCG